MDEGRRIVVTGAGAVTALGHSLEETFGGLCAGDNGIRKIPELEAAGFPVFIGGAVPDLEELQAAYPDARAYRSRKLLYLLKAMDEALASARLESLEGRQTGIYLGVETSRVPFDATFRIFDLAGREGNRVDYEKFGKRCRDIVPPAAIQNKMPSFLHRYLAKRYAVAGPMMATSNACASSNYAIGEAMRKLRSGRIDMAITGSADEMIDEYMVTGFSLLRALSLNNEHPDLAARPFDTLRDGFVLGEGGAVLLLETLAHARRRKAPILCELAGYGTTSDGWKITACDRKGRWLAEAMSRALTDGGLTTGEIDYINAHGTSTQLNDLSETRAIQSLFGDRAREILVNSTKSMLGHTVAAAGAIEAAVTALSLARGICHPTRNHATPDEGCDLNYCPGAAVEKPLRAALSNSCGFSGGNACIAFRRWEGDR